MLLNLYFDASHDGNWKPIVGQVENTVPGETEDPGGQLIHQLQSDLDQRTRHVFLFAAPITAIASISSTMQS
jgi:hypothetical protein